jgi:DNA-directed RNA polymerase specialized sigma24 family protein
MPDQVPAQATYHTMPRLQRDQVKALVADYQAGATVYELAARFGINRKTVSRTLRREQVSIRMASLTIEQIDEAVELYGAGWSTTRIGERLRVDARTVHRRLQERGVSMRDTHGRARMSAL